MFNSPNTMIFGLQDRPTRQCHGSTIAETSSGLVAAWFGGTREGEPDCAIWLARHDGEAWSPPVEAANGIEPSGLRFPCWNPVLFQPRKGSLMLFYKVGPNPEMWWGMLITSGDDGKSWSEPCKLGTDPKIGDILGPVKNKPIQLHDDSILCPSSTELNDIWRVHFELTRDLGETWEIIGPINDGVEFGAIQPSILAHPGGRLQILCRTRQKVIAQSWSEDSGRTWSKMTATSLPNPNSGADAVTLADGRHLLVYNNTRQGRSPLNVALSADGIHWKNAVTLENQQGEFSYPAVIQSRNSMVHIAYTHLRTTIQYVVIDPRQLGNSA